MLNVGNLSSVVSASTKFELLWDPTRELVFFTTTDGFVRSWNPNTNAFVHEINLGGAQLGGLSLTQDGQRLFVAQRDNSGSTQQSVVQIDLANGDAITRLSFNVSGLERGVFDVAVGSNGLGLLTTDFAGSGSNPLRQFDATTGQVTLSTSGRSRVNQSTYLDVSENNRYILLAESNSSSAPISIYDSVQNKIISSTDYYALGSQGFGPFSGFNNGSGAINAAKGLVYNLGVVMDLTLQPIVDLGKIFGYTTVAFANDGASMFMRFGASVLKFDTTNWSILDAYRLQTAPSGSVVSEIRISAENRLLMVETASGFEALDLNFAAKLYGSTQTSDSSAIYGTATDDTIASSGGQGLRFGFGGADAITGTSANDYLDGGEGNDSLNGGAGTGRDTLVGGAGGDTLAGGLGDDVYYADGADTILEDAGGGNDSVFAASSLTLGANLERLTLLGNGAINGSGNAADNLINGGFGANQILGLGGADTINGGAGVDSIYGGDGNDTINGDNDADLLFGDLGADMINGGAGVDSVYGGDANDTINGDNDADLLFGDLGADTINGGAGVDSVYGGDANDRLNGDGDIDLLFGQAGADFINGDAGNDFGLGGDGNDSLFGGADVDTLLGEAGDDLIYGGSGGDVLWGGLGVDRIYGDEGIDYLFGQEGNDILDGGGDVNVYVGGDGNDVMGFASEFNATSATQVFYGETGENLVSGGVAGNDQATGGYATDWFIMEAGDDTMIGGGGNDMFYGGDGNDLIDMREGSFGAPGSGDYAWGHGGNDTFLTRVGQAGVEVIMDFEAGAASGDVVRIVGSTYGNFSNLLAASVESGGFTIIPLGGAEAIYLYGVTKAQLAADDFLFS